MQPRRESQIGVRVDSAFRAEIKAEADVRFDGSESRLLREAARLYIQLRRELGVQFEPTLAIWLRQRDDEGRAA